MMTMRITFSALLTVGTVLLVSGCGSSKSAMDDSPAPDASTVMAGNQGAPETTSTEELESLYWSRIEDGRQSFTQADVDFMTGMIGHHAQALIMAGMAASHGASPKVATLCARIINAQNDEIRTMQQWLRDRGQPVPEVELTGLKVFLRGVDDFLARHAASGHEMAGHTMPGHEMSGKEMAGHKMTVTMGDDGLHMHGMLTNAEMIELDKARGAEFDRLFLQGMIMHHSGAVTMVDNLFETDGAALDEASFKLASDIHVDQITEIARMKQMLAEVNENMKSTDR